MPTNCKKALLERGSIIVATIIAVVSALIRSLQNFSCLFILEEGIPRIFSCLNSFNCSIFSMCLNQSKEEQLVEIAIRLENTGDILEGIDNNNQRQVNALRRVKDAFDRIKNILN